MELLATLDDIARELGISKSTVSKALSGARDVSKAMRQTVLEKAVEMGYSRNARSTEMPKIAVRSFEDKRLWARNKWLLAHKDTSEAAAGAYVGLVGENIDIAAYI